MNSWVAICLWISGFVDKCPFIIGIDGVKKMDLSFSEEERLAFLIQMAGSGNQTLYEVYRDGGEQIQSRILAAMAKGMAALETIMAVYGLKEDPEGLARAMILTEDLIGCEPRGELCSVNEGEAVRKVTSCPWAGMYSADGGTCRLVMAAVQEGLGKKLGLEIACEQNMAEGADHCIWKVKRRT